MKHYLAILLVILLLSCSQVVIHTNPVSYEEVQTQCSKYLGDDQEYYGCAFKALGNCVAFYLKGSQEALNHEILDCINPKINHGDES